MYIWKREYAPFRVGGQFRRAIKTKVDGYPIIDLGRGIKGIYVSGEGVFELESGGLVGKTIVMEKRIEKRFSSKDFGVTEKNGMCVHPVCALYTRIPAKQFDVFADSLLTGQMKSRWGM